MNFQQFGVPISAALPIATQYQGGKITQNVTTPNGQVVGLLQGGENGVHYLRPFDINSFAASQPSTSNGQQAQTLITLPITMPGAKPGDPQQTVQIQVINPQPMSPPSPNAQQKFHMTQIPIQTFGQGATVLTVAYNGNQEGIQIVDGQNGIPEGMTVVAAIQPQDIQLIQADPNEKKDGLLPVALIKSEVNKDDTGGQDNGTPVTAFPAQYLQNTTVQEYLQKMQQNTALPLSLQQFLKFNTPGIKQEQINEDGVLEQVSISTEIDPEQQLVLANSVEYMEQQEENTEDPDKNKKKKKYKKKPAKPKKPKPGQVHIATALDGTTLFCCPECHMAYPDKELLETHLVGHKIERRFICDICGAGLKRKEHLERHKLGHNPERPFVCSVCMKGFKRKEHLNLHYVIHSGEKTEICDECGKGFYRKDHLRKHQRSHVTRRAKEQAERQNLMSKEGTAQVTIQIPPVQQENPNKPQDSVIYYEYRKSTEQEQSQVQNEGSTLPYFNFQMPTQQLQIPVQIQVPQHHIQMTAQQEEENSQVSTVVLPASEALSILPN